jgi:hypothetical protein
MSRMERMFNRGLQLKEATRTEYYRGLLYEDPDLFDDAVKGILETFKPFPSEPFPSLATIKIAILRMVEETEGESGGFHDMAELDFCQQCRNSGFYLGQDGQAHFCICDKGRYRKAAWGVRGGTNRQERVQRTLDKLPASKGGPVRGLLEKNPNGFWELTAEEHEKWMTAKRAEIAEMDARIKDRPSRKKGAVPPESIKRLVEEKIRQVRSNMSALARKSDEGLEDEPFERRRQA